MEVFLLVAVIVLLLGNAVLFVALKGTEKRVQIMENEFEIYCEILGQVENSVNKALSAQRDLWTMQSDINDVLVGKKVSRG